MIWKDYFYFVFDNILNLVKAKKESWLLMTGNILITLINFLIISVLSRFLAPPDYGLLREILLYTGFVVSVGSAGLSQTLYYLSSKYSNQSQFLIMIKQIRILQIFLLLCLTPFILILYHIGFFANLSFLSVIYIIIYIIFLIITCVDLNIALINKRLMHYMIFNSILLSVKFFIIWLVAKNNYYLSGYLLTISFFQVCLFFGNYSLLRSIYFGAKSWIISKEVIKEILKYATPLFITSIIGFVIYNTDKFIVSFSKADKAEFAIISNVAFEIPFIANVYTSFFIIALPRMISNYKNVNIRSFLEERFNYTFTVAKIVLPVVVLCIVWNEELIKIIFGSSYINYAGLFAMFTSISLLRFCSHHDILLATENTKIIMFTQLTEMIFHFIISILLYQIFRLKGLIIAAVITNYTYMIVINLISAKKLEVSVSEILPYKFLISKIFSLFASAIVFKFIIEKFVINHYWWLALFIWVIGVMVFELRKLRIIDNA